MRLENFRLFQDSGWFRLAPLTFLVGRNSSGKSSMLSALLLLKQSYEQDVVGSTQMPLTLSGPYIDLGNFADVVHRHDESAEISISLSSNLSDPSDLDYTSSRPVVGTALPRSPGPYRLGYFGPENVKFPVHGEVMARLTFSADEPFGPSLKRLEVSVKGVGNASFIRTISVERQERWHVYASTLPPRALELSLRSFFPRIAVRDESYRQSSRANKRRLRVFAAANQRLFRTFVQALIRSDAVGPFRTPPGRRYPFGGFNSSRVGRSGEQAVNLLITESLLSPESRRPLRAALSFWLNRLRLAESLNVKDLAKRLNLFQVDLTGAGRRAKANFADVGYGISQVLPVLVQGLLMRPGGFYLVQEPEIHLHPDAQAGLADFFIYLAGQGVTTVVETHSEYLLLRLRRRLAEGAEPISAGLPAESNVALPLNKDSVAVLFTGFDHNQAAIRNIEIGDSFQFENLPPGFMTEALDDRVALLKAVAKQDA
jgi:energy-coupling factor transporter ATP-binding protein EcfA2